MNRIPEKKIQTYKNPEHSDKDLKRQLDELAKSMIAGTYDPYVGTIMGKPVRRSQLKYNAAKQTYEVNVDGITVEVDPKHIQFSNDVKAEDKSSYNSWKDIYSAPGAFVDTGVPYVKMGGSWGSQSKSLVRPRVRPEAYDPASAYDKSAIDNRFTEPWKISGIGAAMFDSSKAAIKVDLGTHSHTSAPWDDPLKDMQDKANNTVACMDMPELRPDYDPNAKPEIYYHDRFPSIPVRDIVNDAILMLRAKKQLNISIHSFSREVDDYRLVIKVIHDNLPPVGSGKIIECLINKKCFDRMKCDADRYAKLRAKLDTNTYLKLRVAWLLYQAQKLSDQDASKLVLDVFRVVSSSTHPIFKF